jgi:hypothetical protein
VLTIDETAIFMMIMGKHAQGLLGALGIGCVGFVVSAVWGIVSGRTMDRDAYIFLSKMWGAIALFGVVLHFII